jgi:hypothetical protein
MAARMPEPHILLSVTAPALWGRQHLGHQLGVDAGTLDSGLDGGAAQVVCSECRKVALERAHGGAGGANDDDGIGGSDGGGVAHGIS